MRTTLSLQRIDWNRICMNWRTRGFALVVTISLMILLTSKTPVTGTVPLLSKGTLAADSDRQIWLVPQMVNLNSSTTGNQLGGSYAWWVSGENQKARLPRPYVPKDTSSMAHWSDTIFGSESAA